MIFTIKKLLISGMWLIATLAMVWAVGFGLFSYGLYHTVPPANNLHSDAIVVLTGGDERVKEGLHLLNRGVGDRLFISGVGQGVTIEDILRTSGYNHLVGNNAFKAHITLGRTADNTRGNAEETAQWSMENDVHSIRLVTAYYHMPRSQLEFHFLMPQMYIIEHPVYPARVELCSKEGMSLALVEYHKYIAVLLRQAGLWDIS